MMSGKLSEKSLEELWQLFPIFLTQHQDCWAKWYEEERELLSKLIPEDVIINHIGSTAVDCIWAKAIIDILIEIPEKSDMSGINEILTKNGYICMNRTENRISLNKGYTDHGFAEKVFHIHLRYGGDNDELYFRDYLTEHPLIAKEYETLKLELWKKFEHDRDGYTDAKGSFVRYYTERAKEESGNKYDRKSETEKSEFIKY